MYKRYENSGFTIEWHGSHSDNSMSVTNIDGEVIKEYFLSEACIAEDLWFVLCEMCDMFPENIAKFKVKRACPEAFHDEAIKIAVE